MTLDEHGCLAESERTDGEAEAILAPEPYFTWVAVAIAGSAIIGGVSSYMSAEKANKPKKNYTDQTSEQLPYAPTIDHLMKILQEQERLYGEGAPDYSKILGGGGGGGGGVGARGEEAMELYRRIAEAGMGAGSTPGVGFGQDAIGSIWGGDMSGGPAPEGGLDPAMVQAAKRFGGDYDKALAFAQANPQSALGRNLAEREAAVAEYNASNPGAGAGTGFEGYNPILADLARELGGSSMDDPMRLLMDFLGENNRSGGGGPQAAEGGGATGGRPPPGTGFTLPRGSSGGGGFGGGGGGNVPDTGRGQGTFQRELDRVFSEEANEEEIAAVLESMAGDIEREGFQQMADLEARAAGSGRFGGDWHSARIYDAKKAQAAEIAEITAKLRYGDLNERRQARLAALNMLNQRDVAAMSDETARAGISASAGSASAGRDLARELAEMENARALRGQDLSAIGSLMQGEQFGLSGLMGLGERLSSDRLSSLSMIPGFESLGLAGLDRSLGAAGGIAGLEEIDAASRRQGAASRDNARTQAGMLQAEAPQRLLNDYLRTVMGIGSMGGTSHTEGMNVVPGAGVSPWAAGAQGAFGGALTGAGIAGQYGGYGGGGGGGGGSTDIANKPKW